MAAPTARDELPIVTGGFGTADTETFDLTADEIEAAYARALETVDAVEQAVPELATDNALPESTRPAKSDRMDASPWADRDIEWPPESSAACHEPSRTSLDGLLSSNSLEHVIQPHQVVEAALFVGGEPLTAKRLSKLLGEDSSGELAESIIARLNERYVEEGRPYGISLQEGGYRLALRAEFENVRDRVYGRNAKEVKLSQEALEVLAFVAYRQPVRCQDVEDAGKVNAAAVLRQLLRRQLVCLQRVDGPSGDVTYATTPRFLEVFGLRHLDELPLPDDLALK